jgi:hypothetical protein
METLAHSKFGTQTVDKSITKNKDMKDFWEMLEFNRFGVIVFVLSIVACFSGIVAGLFVDGDNQFETTLVAALAMATLVSILIVAPIRWIIGVGIAAILINTLLIIF